MCKLTHHRRSMSSDTQQKMIDGACACFFKHGFRGSNMSLISQYAGFSRVTLHKHFKNKEGVFRAMCSDYQASCNAECQLILGQPAPCWQKIEQITAIWSKSAFDDVHDDQVLRELIFEASQVACDIFEEAHQDLEQLLLGVLDEALANDQISLQACQLSSAQLATIIVASTSGIRTHYPREQILQASHQLIELYRLATRV